MGLLYAVGGLTKAGDSLSTVEVMDPVTGRWNPAEAMSIRRSRVGVAVLRNKLYGMIKSLILKQNILRNLICNYT